MSYSEGLRQCCKKTRILRSEGCETLEQVVFTSREPGAARKRFNSFLVVIGEGDEEKEIREARVMLLCRCYMMTDTKSLELAFMEYMESVTPSHAVDEYQGVYVCERRQQTVESMRVKWVVL